jgi:potassium-transporting ATPase KdpC subunit
MKNVIITIKAFLLLTLLTGIVYPLFITGIALGFFSSSSNGNLLVRNDTIIGSALLGQNFISDRYFHSRPSATSYQALPSGGSNLGPTSQKLREYASQNRINFIVNNKLDSLYVVPSEMMFSSASGLDPHISHHAAVLQVDRICRARNFNDIQKDSLIRLISDVTEAPQFFILGEQRVNVLILNIALDKIR